MPDAIPMKEETGHAAFVVTGKIIKKKAATMPDIASDDTLILEIETVLKAPAMFAALAGHQITVRFAKLPDLNEGTVITVYANGWIFGETVAVEAVDYTEASNKKEVVAKVSSQITSEADASLKERVDSAQVAVVGKVVKVEKKEDDKPAVAHAMNAAQPQTTQISEHDPNWHQATIQVDEVLKGAEAKEMKVLFPRSDDVRWYRVQKFQEGQQGIWLLQNSKNQNQKGIPPKILAAIPPNQEAFTSLHANDFLPLDELGKVKSLINQ